MTLKRWLIVTVILALGFIGLTTATLFQRKSALNIDERLAAIRARGEPVTAAEVDASYSKVPDSENAALVYEEAFSKLSLPQNTDRWPLSETNDSIARPFLAPEVRAEVIACLKQNEGGLHLLRLARTRPQARFPTGLEQGWASFVKIPSIEFRNAIYLLLLEAIIAAEQGKSGEATDAICSALHLARSVESHPRLPSYMFGIAGSKMSIAALEIVMTHCNFSTPEMDQLSNFLQARQSSGLTRAIICERSNDIENLEIFRTAQSNIQSGSLFNKIFSGSALFKERDYLTYLDHAEELIAISKLPIPDRLKESERFDTRTKKIGKGLSIMFTPSTYHRAFLLEAERDTSLLLAQAALLTERYRLRHGTLPRSFLEVRDLGDISLDPFSGENFEYRKPASGFIIYSVGVNEKDDGGNESDIVFRVERK